MEKAKPFEDYFSDPKLSADKLERLALVRKLVHEIYPSVKEQVSYAMPGFYPKDATKANQQLFLMQAAKGWLGLYGTFGMTPEDVAPYAAAGVTVGKGNVHIPYDLPEDDLRQVLQKVIDYNLARTGLE
ncbi:MAG: DUF1801 domain-containing protein [Coriobacteriia bacterium]|nr:DUF1801 domain-containing protein [Coriobacteriia bacterium]MCL2537526.1 DUF1801 domain-containing protein [Coriobacteriia bacterium]